MIQLSQDQIVNLFIEKLKLMGSSTSGTYNPADPTHFEKGVAEIGIEHGFTMFTDESQAPYPEPENVLVDWHDCTWGIKFEFETSAGQESGYWSRAIGGVGEWGTASKNFYEVFLKLLLEGQVKDFWIMEECDALMGIHYK